jgi:hypothetical protein
MISHSTKVLARQALTEKLHEIEWEICFSKAMVAKNYDHCDILLPETASDFKRLNFWKQTLRNDRNKAARIRKALKELK